MRILVCGGRGYANKDQLYKIMSPFADVVDVIIHGAAKGADSLAGEWAEYNWTKVEAFPADWEKFGKRAGPIRNATMLRVGKPDLVIAFPGGTGTSHMVEISRKAGIEVMIVAPQAS